MTARHFRARRVPVRLQLNRVECGAACLAMVLSFHGRLTPLSQAREVCRPGRGGVSAKDIAEAARSFGLTARGVRGDPAVLPHLPLPAIAHWGEGHFVVVERWTPRRVDIIDPAWGRQRLTRDEFEDGLGEAILVLQPGPEFDPQAPREPSSARLLTGMMSVVPGIRGAVAQVLVATILLQVLALALPLATKIVVDAFFGDQARDHLFGLLGLGFAVAVAAQVVTTVLRALLLIYLQGRLDWTMLSAFAGHLYRLPARYFHDRTSGDLALRLSSVGALRNLLANQTLAATLDVTLVISYVAVMFFVDPVLAGVVIVILIAQVVPALATLGRSRELVARRMTAQVKVQDYVLQTLSGVGTIKASGAERHVVGALSGRILEWSAVSLRRGQLDAALDAYENLLRNLTPLVLLWLGAVRVLDGSLGAGTLLGFMWLAAAALGPMASLVANWQTLQLASISMERIGDVMRAKPETMGTLRPPPSGTSEIQLELQNLQFTYDSHSAPAIRGISATIRPGQRVAIVGRSGAGKTTLAMLLLGLYTPTSGQIRYEGRPLPDYDLPSVRQHFGAVLQEAFVLRGSVRENITLAHPEATDDDVRWASAIAEVADEVGQLPMGYDTQLGERGVGLSGGQLQRLSLARALVGRPSILVLDEATSYLDSQTERRIVANLRAVSCTQIVIAHRLSTIVDADLILVLEQGRLIESGTHDQLLNADGSYAQLVSAQLPSTAAPVGSD